METFEAKVVVMETQIQRWGAALDRLVARAEENGTEMKNGYGKQMDDLKAKYATARTKLDELRNVSAENRETLKAGIESAWTELEAAFTTVTKRTRRAAKGASTIEGS